MPKKFLTLPLAWVIVLVPMLDDVGMYMQGDLVLWRFNCKFDPKSAHLTAHWITHAHPTDAYGSKGGTKFAHFQPHGGIAALHIYTFDVGSGLNINIGLLRRWLCWPVVSLRPAQRGVILRGSSQQGRLSHIKCMNVQIQKHKYTNVQRQK